MITKNFTVYCHTNKLNGKKYVGITKQKPEKRWNNGYGYSSQSLFYNAIKKYGWHNFMHEILYTNLTKKEAEEKEIQLINEWQTNDRNFGYNIEGGGNLGKEVSEETKIKMRLNNLGKKQTKETIEKRRAKMLGRVLSVETRAKIGFKNKHNGERKVDAIFTNGAIVVFASIKDASETTGVHAYGIGECCRNRRKTAGGVKWRYHLDNEQKT